MYLELENRTDFLGETFIAVSLIKGCGRLEAMLPFQNKKESTGRRRGRKQTREKSLFHWPCYLACVDRSRSLILPLCFQGAEESLVDTLKPQLIA